MDTLVIILSIIAIIGGIIGAIIAFRNMKRQEGQKNAAPLAISVMIALVGLAVLIINLAMMMMVA